MNKSVLKIVIILLLLLFFICIYGTYKGNKIKENKNVANEQTILTEYMTKFMLNNNVKL